MLCLKTDYAVQLQQEGHLSQGLLGGLWCEPQWEQGSEQSCLENKAWEFLKVEGFGILLTDVAFGK